MEYVKNTPAAPEGHIEQRVLSRWIAWLEKQKQEPMKVSIWKHWKDGICGNGEGKLIYLIKAGNDYSLSSSLGFECDYIELSELDNLMLEKQGTSYTKRDVDDAFVEGMALAKDELEKQGEQKQKPTNEDMKEALRTEYEKGRADAFILQCPHFISYGGLSRGCLLGYFPANCESCTCSDKHYIEITTTTSTTFKEE